MEDILRADRVKIFLPDNDLVWISADIIEEIKPGHYEVEIDDGDYDTKKPRRKVITMQSLCRSIESLPLQNKNMSETGVEDMCTLDYLHEPSILDNLRRRHKSCLPYTYTGDICIAINPYQWLDIYTIESRDLHATHVRTELSPHAYATSAAAYRGLRDNNCDQSILVSGESGAGKTETVKILMGHIAHISGRLNVTAIDKVLKANPLLESFGNAKTSRNDNSSRFGKFTRLQFDNNYMLAGSRCVTYLLEKSRVISQNELERNYHIFHQIFAAPEEVKDSLFLAGMDCSQFRYTGMGDLVTKSIEDVSDGARFLQTMQVLELLGVGTELRKDLQRILSGILYLGQIPFLGDTDNSYIDPASFGDATKCCELLGLEQSAFYKNTTVRRICTNEEELLVSLSMDQASDGRDALAKDTYDRLFQWLVVAINESTAADSMTSPKLRNEKIIALLDIFGFESFEVNRFEQLCINYANEKLQQRFTEDVFKVVQAEYQAEGLKWELISYEDNADVLDLLEGKLGILDLLNEECLVPRGSDSNFLAKISQNNARHPCFTFRGLDLNRDEFRITHYAGKVTYSTIGFMDRNRDAIPSELKQLMLTTSNKLLHLIYSVDVECRIHEGKRVRTSFLKADTVTTKFKSQLSALMDTITGTDVQYVRCIKPNTSKSRQVFDRNMVVEQLRSAGVIAAIKISRAAYPYRISHSEFVDRFKNLRPTSWMRKTGATRPDAVCKLLLQDVMKNLTDDEKAKLKELGCGSKPMNVYEMGYTKVYFSTGVLELLEGMRGAVVHVQVKLIQRAYRGSRDRRMFAKLKRCATMIKRTLLGWKHRGRFLKLKKALLSLQCMTRMKCAKNELKKRKLQFYATKLQSWVRMLHPKKVYHKKQKAAVVLHAWIRMIVQKIKFTTMINDVRENNKLSSQLEHLKNQLQLEAEARQSVEKLAAEKMASEKLHAEQERKELIGTAETEKAEIREEVRLLLEHERVKAKEEQEALRAQMVKQAAESQEREIALKELYLEIARLKAEKAATVAAAEAERRKVSERRAEIAAAAAIAAVKAAAAASAAAEAASVAAANAAAVAAAECEKKKREMAIRAIEEEMAAVKRREEERVLAIQVAEQKEKEKIAAEIKAEEDATAKARADADAADVEAKEMAEATAAAATALMEVSLEGGLTSKEVGWLTDAGVNVSVGGESPKPGSDASTTSEGESPKISARQKDERNRLARKEEQEEITGQMLNDGFRPHLQPQKSDGNMNMDGFIGFTPPRDKVYSGVRNGTPPTEDAGYFVMSSARSVVSDTHNGSRSGSGHGSAYSTSLSTDNGHGELTPNGSELPLSLSKHQGSRTSRGRYSPSISHSASDQYSEEMSAEWIQNEILEKERTQMRGEKVRTAKLIKQYKMEKSHVLETMVNLHEELDQAHKTHQKLNRTVKHVQSLKEMQEKLTLSVLKSRAVDSDIIEELRRTVFTPSDPADIDEKIGYRETRVEKSNSVASRYERAPTPVRPVEASVSPRTPMSHRPRREERDRDRAPETSGKHSDAMSQMTVGTSLTNFSQATSADIKERELHRRRKQALAFRGSNKDPDYSRSRTSADESDRILGGIDAEGDLNSLIMDGGYGSEVGKDFARFDDESVAKGTEVYPDGTYKDDTLSATGRSEAVVVEPAVATTGFEPILALFDFSSYYS